ncbi:MAG TPA: DEAD/DEAH box helicase [Candidatus Aquilonibacter sp.]
MRTAIPKLIYRDYQREALDEVARAFVDRGIRRAVVALPTGLGKTIVMAGLPETLDLPRGSVTLVLTHRDELIEQTVEKFHIVSPARSVELEAATRRATGDADVIVASVATLRGARLASFVERFGGNIALAIVDEAHHAVAPTYRRIIDALFAANPKLLLSGFTATPNRGDRVGLGEVFEEVTYFRSIKWAIEHGYLVPVSSWRVDSGVSLDDVSVRAGDFALGELGEAVDTDRRNDLIVSAYLDHTPNQQAIAFAVNVEHARHLAERFTKAGIRAAFASGETPSSERREIIRAFRAREVQVLCNCALYTEGFDEPGASCVISARPTQSSLLYTQMAGRGLRPSSSTAHHLGPSTTQDQRLERIAASDKPSVTILDVTDNATRHTLMTFPALWGLPSRLDAQGKTIAQLEDIWSKLLEHDPLAEEHADSVDTFQKVAHRIEQIIDPFSLPVKTEFLKTYTELAWVYSGANVYHLWTAGGEYLEVRLDLLDKAEVLLVRGGNEVVILRANTIADALQRAEEWVAMQRPHARSTEGRRRRARPTLITAPQRRKLRELGVPEDRIPAGRGDAHALYLKLKRK